MSGFKVWGVSMTGPVCATCHQPVYVKTGLKWEDGDSCHACELEIRDARFDEMVSTIARLEAENAELRAEVERLRTGVECHVARPGEGTYECHIDKPCPSCRLRTAEQEVERLRRALDLPNKKLAEAWAKNESLAEISRLTVKVLLDLEWSAIRPDREPPAACPMCHWLQSDGHVPDCDLDAALRKAGAR